MKKSSEKARQRRWLLKAERRLTQLLELHKLFTSFTVSRGAEAQKADEDFLGFNDVGIMCLLATSTVMTRHISAMRHLLSAGYPVQAMILLRPLIESWFYLVMFFEEPAKAEDYFKSPTDSRSKPKYKPYQVKDICLNVIRTSDVPHSERFAALIAEQYRIACDMVHMSNSLLYASFAVFSGEKHIPFDGSSHSDENLYVAYGRILHVSSAFWITLLMRFLINDKHEYTGQVIQGITDYFYPTFDLVGEADLLFESSMN
jgi:hypothetical protein